jgi:hypothetical protein
MTRILSTCIAALLCIFIMAQTAPAADKPTIILLSTPFGTGSYVLGTAMESIVNQGDYPVTVSHAETPGQAFNVMKLGGDEAARKNTVVVATSGIEWLAQRGMKPFKQTYEPLKVIGTLNYAITWLVTTDKSIKTMADLHGKRIALGRVPQIVWGYEPDALLRNGYTDEFYKSLRIQFVGTTEAANALVNGQVDAAVIGGYLDPIHAAFSPSPQTVEVMASGRSLTHLDWTREAVDNTAVKDITLLPFELPANTVEGQAGPLWAGAEIQAFCVHPDFPEEYAYILTKAMIDNVEAFAQYHAMGSLMSREALVKGWKVEDFHPGALRAYKEAGLL